MAVGLCPGGHRGAARADLRTGEGAVRAAVRPLPRRRRARRRDGTGHRVATGPADGRRAGRAGARRLAGKGDARPRPPGRRPAGARRLHADPPAGPRRRAGAPERHDGRRQRRARRRPQSHGHRRAAPRRWRRPAPAAPDRRRVAPGHVAGRLADLPRRSRRQSLQPGRPDQSRHGRAPRAGVGVPAARRLEPAGDAGRGRRGDVRHQRQRVLRAGRRVGAAHLALSAAADEGPRRRRRLGDQPRRGGGRRSRLHGHRPRPPPRAQPLHRRSRVGDADGRLAAELRRHVRAARRRQPGRVGDLGRRRRRPRVPRRVRSRDRQGSVAVLDGAARPASPAPRPGAARRSRTAAPRRG